MAAQALAAHDLPTAAHIFGEILQEEPGHPKAVAGLARCYLESGDIERAKKTLGLVRPDGQSDEAIRAVEAELALKERAANAGDVGPLKARIDANPADLEARLQLAHGARRQGRARRRDQRTARDRHGATASGTRRPPRSSC